MKSHFYNMPTEYLSACPHWHPSCLGSEFYHYPCPNYPNSTPSMFRFSLSITNISLLLGLKTPHSFSCCLCLTYPVSHQEWLTLHLQYQSRAHLIFHYCYFHAKIGPYHHGNLLLNNAPAFRLLLLISLHSASKPIYLIYHFVGTALFIKSLSVVF